jgi:hypothetical protein
MSPLRALRARCLDCCGQQANEVAACSAVACPSWPFRMGTDPWRKPASEARREAARREMAQINRRRREGGGSSPRTGSPEHGTAPLLATGSEVGLTSATGRGDRGLETELDRERPNGRPKPEINQLTVGGAGR